MKITGTFDVSLKPLESYATGKDGVKLAHMSIDKTFHGELNGQSQGQMLSAVTAVQGSAGYVAIEQFSGTLKGKTGSFVLQHFGTMDKGADHLILEVVPDSASEELEDLKGNMKISIEGEQHHYTFEYNLKS